MPSAACSRRLGSFAHIGVMMSLLFCTVHPVQPAISTRGATGRAGQGSRFESWSDAATIDRDETELAVDDRRVSTLLRTAAGGAANDEAGDLALPIVWVARVAPTTLAGRLSPGAPATARSRSVRSPSGRAPPRA